MDYLQDVIHTAQLAGAEIMRFFNHAFAQDVTLKDDHSPVTKADVAANAVIVKNLKRIAPDIPILSEESTQVNYDTRKAWQRFWLVDPLDGTRGFIARSPEFSVNIALIENHQPVMGVLYAPATGECCYATKNKGAFFTAIKNPTPVRLSTTSATDTLRFVCGRFDRSVQLKETLKKYFKNVSLAQMNSAIKFSYIARGLGDLYVRLGATSEWDTAAGQCVVEEAGGAVVDFEGRPLQYNAKSSLLNPYFLAIGDVSQCERYVKLVNTAAGQLHEKNT